MIKWPHIGLLGEFDICEEGLVSALNKNFYLLDTLLNLKITDFVNDFPVVVEEGENYILTQDVGDFLTNSIIAYSEEYGWTEVIPEEGYLAYAESAASLYIFKEDSWQPIGDTFGDVYGPPTSFSSSIARFADSSGKVLTDSVVILSEEGNITTPGNINANTVNAPNINNDVANIGLNISALLASVKSENTQAGTAITLNSPQTSYMALTGALISISEIAAPTDTASAHIFILVNNTGEDVTFLNNAFITTGTEKDLRVKDGASIIVAFDPELVKHNIIGGSGGGGSGVLIVPDIATRNLIEDDDRYDGLIVYVEDQEMNFQLQGGITNADWITLNYTTDFFSDDVGAIIPNVREFSDAPTGTLPCNGSSYNVVDYPLLAPKMWNSVQSKWKFGGTGNLTTGTFLTPNLVGMFLRGAGGMDAAFRTASGINGVTANAVGSFQGHAYQTHAHAQSAHTHNNGLRALVDGFTITQVTPDTTGGPATVADKTGGNVNWNTGRTDSAQPAVQNASATGTNSEPTANETRPVNIAVNYFIRYQPASKGEKGDPGSGVYPVADIAGRNAIDPSDRNEGMIAYVISEQKNYQLVGGIANANWKGLASSITVSATQTLANAASIVRIGERTERVKVQGDADNTSVTVTIAASPTPQDGDQLFIQGMNDLRPVSVGPFTDLAAGQIGQLMYDAQSSTWMKVGGV